MMHPEPIDPLLPEVTSAESTEAGPPPSDRQVIQTPLVIRESESTTDEQNQRALAAALRMLEVKLKADGVRIHEAGMIDPMQPENAARIDRIRGLAEPRMRPAASERASITLGTTETTVETEVSYRGPGGAETTVKSKTTSKAQGIHVHLDQLSKTIREFKSLDEFVSLGIKICNRLVDRFLTPPKEGRKPRKR